MDGDGAALPLVAVDLHERGALLVCRQEVCSYRVFHDALKCSTPKTQTRQTTRKQRQDSNWGAEGVCEDRTKVRYPLA